MKRTVLALTLGILLIAVNLYAADGDLYVDGKVGIGTESPTSKLHIVGDQKLSFDFDYGTAFVVEASSSFPAGTLKGVDFTLVRAGNGTLTGDTVSGKFVTGIANDGNVSGAITPLIVRTQFGSPIPGTTTITSPQASGIYLHWWGVGNSRTYNVTSTLSDLRSLGIEATSGTGSLNVTDFRHILVNASAAGNINSETGLWVDKQIRATTNNYGIVLNGDGAGADIVFGPNHDSKIYSSSGELYAKDAAGNVTQISPHDPETGEWIYYSKNIKTGRTVRVNMEELVSDMEKLTGKKYLIETLVNEK